MLTNWMNSRELWNWPLGIIYIPPKVIISEKGANIRKRDFGTDFNLQSDFTGCTPLHYAVFQGDKKMIKLLLDSGFFVFDLGGDITLRNSYGETPYDLAMTNDVKELISTDFQKVFIILTHFL